MNLPGKKNRLDFMDVVGVSRDRNKVKRFRGDGVEVGSIGRDSWS